MSLADKLRKARELEVKSNGFTFTVRRPTDLEMVELQSKSAARAIIPFIIGWEGVSELSMFDGGTPHPIQFDSDACDQWLQDRLDILSVIIAATYKAYEEHQIKVSEAAKN